MVGGKVRFEPEEILMADVVVVVEHVQLSCDGLNLELCLGGHRVNADYHVDVVALLAELD